MCGIAGIVLDDQAAPVDRWLLEAMARAIAHRGPDGEAVFTTPGVGLASRRLAVIDVAAGMQPLSNEDGSIVAVYNGAIYNHAELREALERKGHRFRSRTDGEVLCHLYEEHGDAMLGRLRGMFAFALWDGRSRRLLLVRDRLGIKPLYYAPIPDGLAFASELKALLALPEIGRDLDPVALSDYLTYLYVPSPRTIFAGVRKLPPGSLLVFSQGRAAVTSWWEPPSPPGDAEVGPDEAAHELLERLRETVRAHLVSDVPVGAFLSGGLDSSAVVALMAEVSADPVRTFTVGFEDAGAYDERPAARAVADRLGCTHTEVVMRSDDVGRLLPGSAWHLDEPLGDATALACYALAREARKHVTVVLTGIGGDEVFAGYRRYLAQRVTRTAAFLPDVVLHRLAPAAVRRLPASGRSRPQDLVRLARKFLTDATEPLERRYLSWNAAFTAPEKAALLNVPNGADSLAWAEGFFSEVPEGTFASRAQIVDLRTYLPHDPLALTDATTMAHGLEARVPLCDHTLAEWSLRLPSSLHVQGLRGKALLRRAVAPLLPASALRRPKRGFSLPTDLWLRGVLSDDAARLLDPRRLRPEGLFRAEAVASLLAAHRSGRRDCSQHLWALLAFQVWYRLFAEGSAPERLAEVG